MYSIIYKNSKKTKAYSNIVIFITVFFKVKTYRYITLPIILFAFIINIIGAEDSTNPNAFEGLKDMDPKCKAYFSFIQKNINNTSCLPYIDSLRIEAKRIKDPFALMLSYMSTCRHYCSVYNLSKMEESAQKFQEVTRNGNNQIYFYRSFQMLIKAHLDHRAFGNALQVAQDMLNSAIERNDKYGMWISYRELSHIYEEAENIPLKRLAITNYLQYWPDGYSSYSIAPYYARLAEVTDEPLERLKTLEKGMKMSKTYYDSAQVKSAYLRHYATNRDTIAFQTLYEECVSHPKFPGGFSMWQRTLYSGFHELFNGNKAKAEEILSNLKDVSESKYAKNFEDFYLVAYDYEKAYYWHKKIDSLHHEKQMAIIVNDVNVYNTRRASDSLRFKIANLDQQLLLESVARENAEQQNARLTAEKQRAIAERKQREAEKQQREMELKLTRAEAEKNMMRLKEVETEKQQEAQRLHSLKVEAQNKIMQQRMVLMIIGGVFLVFIVASLIYNSIKKKNMLDEMTLLNRDLEAARKAAEQANKMKDIFIQNMSHELRTPMNAIAGFSQILTMPGMEVTDEEKEEYGGYISTNISMLTMLIDDILNLSDIQSGNFKINYEKSMVKDICNSSINIVQYRLPSNVELKYNDKLPKDFSITIDPKRCQQVLVNYLTNACKHTSDGYIELCTEPDTIEIDGKHHDAVLFSVTDTGTGVPTDQAENIFERFTKLDDFKQGNGLGLNICRHIATKLNARVWCDKDYIGGARFYFLVPINQPNTFL